MAFNSSSPSSELEPEYESEYVAGSDSESAEKLLVGTKIQLLILLSPFGIAAFMLMTSYFGIFPEYAPPSFGFTALFSGIIMGHLYGIFLINPDTPRVHRRNYLLLLGGLVVFAFVEIMIFIIDAGSVEIAFLNHQLPLLFWGILSGILFLSGRILSGMVHRLRIESPNLKIFQ